MDTVDNELKRDENVEWRRTWEEGGGTVAQSLALLPPSKKGPG